MQWDEIYLRLAQDRGDPAAWAALERHIQPWARRHLWRRGWPTIEDAVADTCATVALAFDRARGAETFAGFVYGTFLNARRRLLREPVPEPNGPEPTAEELGDPLPDEVALLQRCLGRLPPRERRAVELRYLADASTDEIAAALDVSAGNARQLVFRGLAKLRHYAREEWPLGRG